MGAFGPLHWAMVAAIALVLFGGKGKISGLMGDTAKGLKAFRDGLKDEQPRLEPETDHGSRDEAGHSD